MGIKLLTSTVGRKCVLLLIGHNTEPHMEIKYRISRFGVRYSTTRQIGFHFHLLKVQDITSIEDLT